MDIIKVFGDNLRKYRTAMGISQEAFADKCGMHRTYISAIECYRRSISLENIQRIADALGIETYKLFLEEDKNAKKENKNVILLTGHVFNWEWFNALATIIPQENCFPVYRKVQNSFWEEKIKGIRNRFGNTALEAKEVIRHILRNPTMAIRYICLWQISRPMYRKFPSV